MKFIQLFNWAVHPQHHPLPVVFLIVYLLMGCSHAKKAEQPGGTAEPKTYSVLTLSPRKVTLYFDVPATIQGQQNVEIRPKVGGYLEAVYVDEGATACKGQRLFRINAPQYAQAVRTAQAGIATAQAEVDAARMAVNKVRPLVEKGIISQYELESAQYTFQSKQAALAQAKASLANANTNLGYTSLISPVSGVVGSIPYKIGSLVSGTTTNPLTTISSIGWVYAYFSLNEKEVFSFIRTIAGSTLQDKLAQLPDVLLLLADGSLYNQKGRVKTAIGQVNSETGSLNFRATFSNPQSLLRSGNSGTVRVPHTIDSALVVPQSATYEIQGKRFLYTVGPDNVVKNTEITVLATPDGNYFVVQQGPKPGAKVVLNGAMDLKDSTKINPQLVQATSVYGSSLL